MRYQVDQAPNGVCGKGSELRKLNAKKPHQQLPDLDIWARNLAVPEPVEACVHGLIKRTVWDRLSAPAICSWDGDLTYKQLDQSSSWLSHRLVSQGVGPGTVVLLCFEKSLLAPVAMLAVMKAGAASMALDVTQPEDRLRAMTAQVSATVILCSAANDPLAHRLGPGHVVVDRELLSGPGSATAPELHNKLPAVSPSDLLCVVFGPDQPGAEQLSHLRLCAVWLSPSMAQPAAHPGVWRLSVFLPRPTGNTTVSWVP